MHGKTRPEVVLHGTKAPNYTCPKPMFEPNDEISAESHNDSFYDPTIQACYLPANTCVTGGRQIPIN